MRAENFDINFSVFLATSANYLLKEGRLDTNKYPCLNLRFS